MQERIRRTVPVPHASSWFDPDGLADTTFVRIVEYHAEIGSTNDRARALGSTAELPALVVADRQSHGRGRGGNRWWSGDGALLFSIVLDRRDVGIAPARRPLVALATGLAVRSAVAETCPTLDARLKWPNDVLIADRKLCGILVEEADDRIVIGVGLNVNNAIRTVDAASSTVPSEITARATSLVDELGSPVDRGDLLRAVLVALEAELVFVADESNRIDHRWAPHCALAQRPIRLRVHDRIVEGTCGGIDDGGALLVHTAAGTERVVSGVVERFR